MKCASRVVEREAAHVERPQVERRPAFEDPLRHHLAGAAAGGDAVEEAGGDEVVVELGHLAHHEVGVGRVRDRTVDHRADAGLLDHRCALARRASASCSKRSKFGVEQLALERRRDAVDPERQRVGLVAADQQPGPVGLVVHEVIRVAHRRHLPQLGRREVGDRTGQHVLVLDRDGRNAHAGHAPDLHAPHPGRVDDHLARRCRPGPVCTVVHSPPVDGDRRDLGVLADLARCASAHPWRSPA